MEIIKYLFDYYNRSMWNQNRKKIDCDCLLFSANNQIHRTKDSKITIQPKKKMTLKNKQSIEKQSPKRYILSKSPTTEFKPEKKLGLGFKASLINSKIRRDQSNDNVTNKILQLKNNFKQILKIPQLDQNPKHNYPQAKQNFMGSQYFSEIPVNKRPAIQFKYRNINIQTINNNIVRQSSLNDISKNSNESGKTRPQTFKRSQSEKQIFRAKKNQPPSKQFITSNLVEQSKCIKQSLNSKSNNLQQLRPRSIISSGADKHSEQNSEFSQVIESVKIRKGTPNFYQQPN